MGFFDSIKKAQRESVIEPSKQPMPRTEKVIPPSEQPISENEAECYEPDEYYAEESFAGTPFARRVITFEERKKSTFPSRNGLYPAEILLLEYCKYGTYPHPRNGYPGFWWFEYGIRNVRAALKSLEERGFIQYIPAMESLTRLTVPQLRDILTEMGANASGKKTVLVARIQESASEEYLCSKIPNRQYTLTSLGQQETRENDYVKYMHQKKPHGMDVWNLNQLIYENPKTPWRELLLGAFNNQLHKYDTIDQQRSLRWQDFNDNQIVMNARHSISTNTTLAGYKDIGIDRYTFYCLLDIHTCPVCGNLDGKDFAVSEAVPGVNLPPMHDGCRCFIGPYQPKEELTGTKPAQMISGDCGYVPETMTWREWRDEYVKGHESQFIESDNFLRNRYSYTANMPRVKKVIEQNPGILQKNLPEHLGGIPKHVVLGNLKNLVEEGTVIKKRAGNSFALYLSE